MKKLVALLCMLVMLASVMGPALSEGEAIEYPLDTNVTLRMWIPMNTTAANYIQTYDENESFNYAQEATGIDIEFIHPSSTGVDEEFNLLVVSGDLPDIIVNHKYKAGDVAAVEDGLFLDLTEYMAEFSPTYYSYITGDVEFYRDATTDDGRILTYTNYKDVDTDIEGSWDRFIVRADWLEEIGLTELWTIADYELYFQHVLDTKEGVTPFTMVKGGIERNFLTAYNILEGWYQVDGEIHYGPYQPEFKEYLELMNSWYQKGFISNDFTTYSSEAAAFRAGISGGYNGTTVDAWIYSNELDMPIQSNPYMRVDDPNQVIQGFYKLRPWNGQTANIAADSKNYAEALMFMDYGYTLEGSYTYCYGIPGVAWNYDANGLPEYTDHILKNEKYNISEVDYILRLHEGFPHMRDSDRFSIPSNIADPSTVNFRLQWQDDPNYKVDWVMPANMQLSPETASRRGEIMTEVETYRDEMVLKFIVGAEPLENFDKYLETLQSLGMDEAISLTQDAYNSYLEKTIPE